jgi:hypothetical protein
MVEKTALFSQDVGQLLGGAGREGERRRLGPEGKGLRVTFVLFELEGRWIEVAVWQAWDVVRGLRFEMWAGEANSLPLDSDSNEGQQQEEDERGQYLHQGCLSLPHRLTQTKMVLRTRF